MIDDAGNLAGSGNNRFRRAMLSTHAAKEGPQGCLAPADGLSCQAKRARRAVGGLARFASQDLAVGDESYTGTRAGAPAPVQVWQARRRTEDRKWSNSKSAGVKLCGRAIVHNRVPV